MKDITGILQSLGLLDSEIKTYLAAMKYGPATAAELGKKAGLSRQAIYVAMDALSERGLMSSVLSGKKRLYSAEPPEKLLSYAKRKSSDMEERMKDLERMLPELELHMGGARPTVRVFEGYAGVRAIIEDMKKSKAKHHVEITDRDAMERMLPEDLEKLRVALRSKSHGLRGLYSGIVKPGGTAKERYMLPKEFSNFHANIGIYGDKIIMVTFEGKMHSLTIESPALIKTLGILFELAFKGSQEYLQKYS